MKIAVILTLLMVAPCSAMERTQKLERLDQQLKTHVEQYIKQLQEKCVKLEHNGYHHGAIFCHNEVMLIKGAFAELMNNKHAQATSSFYASGLSRVSFSRLVGQKKLQAQYSCL